RVNSSQKSYVPSTEELNQILRIVVKKVGYNYDIEAIIDKSLLEREMQEFLVGVRQLKNGKEYSLFSSKMD
ncbi:191_t:CDS:1, partial [Gigaspora margarita]